MTHNTNPFLHKKGFLSPFFSQFFSLEKKGGFTLSMYSLRISLCLFLSPHLLFKISVSDFSLISFSKEREIERG